MNRFRLINAAGVDSFRLPGVLAILHNALPEYRQDAQAAELVIRFGADLSAAAADNLVPAGALLIDLAVRVSDPEHIDDAEASRARLLLTVEDRVSRDALARRGIDSAMLPCPAAHAWRHHPATDNASGERLIAVPESLRARTQELSNDMERHGYRAMVVADTEAASFSPWLQCAGAVTDDFRIAALLAGRGVPTSVIATNAGSIDEFVLPWYGSPESVDMREVLGHLYPLMADPATSRRLLAVEQRAFDTHSRFVRQSLGLPEDSGMLNQRLAALRHRLSTPSGSVMPPERKNLVYTLTLLALDGEEFVREAYAQLLGRPADEDGLRHWTARLADGASKQECLAELAASPEAQMQPVRLVDLPELLQNWLLGQMSPDSLSRWTELVQSGAMTHQDVIAAVARCDGPARLLMAVDEIRHELRWQRQTLEWLLPARS